MNTRSSTIGFIGAGPVVQKLAPLAIRAGHDVVISNSRGPATLTGLTRQLGPRARAGSVAQAAALETVILAVPWAGRAVLDDLSGWGGRILIDATNHFRGAGPGAEDLGTSTGSEVIAGHASSAKVVKAFNGLRLVNYDLKPAEVGRRVMFIASDHPDAAGSVRHLADAMGFFPMVFDTLHDGRLFQLGGPLVDVPLAHLS